MVDEIQTVDLRPFLNPLSPVEEKEKSVAALKEACETQGLFLLTGHGIPPGIELGSYGYSLFL